MEKSEYLKFLNWIDSKGLETYIGYYGANENIVNRYIEESRT